MQAEGVPAGFRHSVRYTVYGNGMISMVQDITCFGALPPLPRLGVSLIVPAGFETFTWFGRGPEESYEDRKAGVAVGRYQGTVADQYVPYIMPQENGNKTDVRWAALSNADGIGLLVRGEPLMQVSVSHFSTDTLYHAMHTHELVPDPHVHFHLDLMQSGLGGASCGPRTLDKYLVWPGEYHATLLFQPFDSLDTLKTRSRMPIIREA